jgi:hypothetical protein
MTRLTLEWHLRGIVEGVVNPVCVRQDIKPDDQLGGWDKTGTRYYADPHVENNREQRTQAGASSYTTGFTQSSGDFCDAFEVPAREALDASDTVRFLHGVCKDPVRGFQERADAARLLTIHIWPNEPNNTGLRVADGHTIHATRDDIDFSEWFEKGLVRTQHKPRCEPLKCPNCRNEENFWDFDPVDEGTAHEPEIRCNCGWEPPEPEMV